MESTSQKAAADTSWGTTIAGVSTDPAPGLSSLVLDQPDTPGVRDLAIDRKFFKIRVAGNHGHRNTASMLINKMYSWRGYDSGSLHLGENPNRITLCASMDGHTFGTLTLGFDSDIGLLVDEMYRPEADALRRQGRKISELTKLAVDQTTSSKRVLATLFHIAYMYGRTMNRVTDCLIEVNPRHVTFYRRMLGFEPYGPERMCSRVGAPAVLLRLELKHVDSMIDEFGGRAGQVVGEKSLYPYFFSKREAAEIASRIMRIG